MTSLIKSIVQSLSKVRSPPAPNYERKGPGDEYEHLLMNLSGACARLGDLAADAVFLSKGEVRDGHMLANEDDLLNAIAEAMAFSEMLASRRGQSENLRQCIEVIKGDVESYLRFPYEGHPEATDCSVHPDRSSRQTG